MAQVERISHLPKPHLSKKSKNPKPNTETQPKSSLTTKTPHTPIFYGPTSSEAGPSNSGQKNGHPGASDLSSVTRKRLDELSRMHVALAQGIPEIPSSICGSPRPPPSSSPEPSASSVRRGKQRMREDVMAPALSPHPREMEETEQEKAKEESEMSPGVLDDVLAGIESSLARNPRIRRLRNKIYAALEDCNFDTSNGKWSVLSALVRTGVIAGGTRWVGARADGVAPSVPALLGLEDSKEATKGSPLGWCNAETEEEWFKWEKRFDEEMTFRKRVEQWKQGIVAGVPEEDEQQPNVSQHPDDPQSSFSRPNQSDSYEALYGAPNHKPLQRKDSSGIFRPPSKSPKKNLATILSNTRKAKPRTIVSNAHAMLRTAGPDKVHKLATSFADAHARTNAASSKRNPLLDDPLKDTSTPLGFAMGKRGAASRVSAKRAKPTMQDKERHQLSQSRSQSQFQGQEKDHPHSQQQHSDTFELYGTHDGGRDEREITTQERRALANDISFPSRKITDLSADSLFLPPSFPASQLVTSTPKPAGGWDGINVLPPPPSSKSLHLPSSLHPATSSSSSSSHPQPLPQTRIPSTPQTPPPRISEPLHSYSPSGRSTPSVIRTYSRSGKGIAIPPHPLQQPSTPSRTLDKTTSLPVLSASPGSNSIPGLTFAHPAAAAKGKSSGSPLKKSSSVHVGDGVYGGLVGKRKREMEHLLGLVSSEKGRVDEGQSKRPRLDNMGMGISVLRVEVDQERAREQVAVSALNSDKTAQQPVGKDKLSAIPILNSVLPETPIKQHVAVDQITPQPLPRLTDLLASAKKEKEMKRRKDRKSMRRKSSLALAAAAGVDVAVVGGGAIDVARVGQAEIFDKHAHVHAPAAAAPASANPSVPLEVEPEMNVKDGLQERRERGPEPEEGRNQLQPQPLFGDITRDGDARATVDADVPPLTSAAAIPPPTTVPPFRSSPAVNNNETRGGAGSPMRVVSRSPSPLWERGGEDVPQDGADAARAGHVIEGADGGGRDADDDMTRDMSRDAAPDDADVTRDAVDEGVGHVSVVDTTGDKGGEVDISIPSVDVVGDVSVDMMTAGDVTLGAITASTEGEVVGVPEPLHRAPSDKLDLQPQEVANEGQLGLDIDLELHHDRDQANNHHLDLDLAGSVEDLHFDLEYPVDPHPGSDVSDSDDGIGGGEKHLDMMVPLRNHEDEDDGGFAYDDDDEEGGEGSGYYGRRKYAVDAASDVDPHSPSKSLSSLAWSDSEDSDDEGYGYEGLGDGNPVFLAEVDPDMSFDPPFASTQVKDLPGRVAEGEGEGEANQVQMDGISPTVLPMFQKGTVIPGLTSSNASSSGPPHKMPNGNPGPQSSLSSLHPVPGRNPFSTPGKSSSQQRSSQFTTPGKSSIFPPSSGYGFGFAGGYNSQFDVAAKVADVDRLLERDVDFDSWLTDSREGGIGGGGDVEE